MCVITNLQKFNRERCKCEMLVYPSCWIDATEEEAVDGDYGIVVIIRVQVMPDRYCNRIYEIERRKDIQQIQQAHGTLTISLAKNRQKDCRKCNTECTDG